MDLKLRIKSLPIHEFLLVLIIIGVVAYSLPGIDENVWPCGNEGVATNAWIETANNYPDKCYKSTSAFCTERQPGIAFLILLSSEIFGVGVLAAKLTSIFINIASIIFLYLFARIYWSKNVAIFSSFFMAFSPIFFFMRNFLSGEILVPLFISMILWTYAKWLTTNKKKYFQFLFVFSGIGMFLGDWAIYFIMPVIVLHYFLFVKKKTKDKKLFLLIPLGVVAFLAFIGYLLVLIGDSSGVENLIDTFFFRTNMDIKEGHIYDLTFFNFFKWFFEALELSYTSLLSYLPFLFFILLLMRLKSNNSEKYVLTFMIFLSLTSFLFIFSNLFLWHRTMILILAPAMGLFGAILLDEMRVIVAKRNNIILTAGFYLFVSIFIMAFFFTSYTRYIEIYQCIRVV